MCIDADGSRGCKEGCQRSSRRAVPGADKCNHIRISSLTSSNLCARALFSDGHLILEVLVVEGEIRLDALAPACQMQVEINKKKNLDALASACQMQGEINKMRNIITLEQYETRGVDTSPPAARHDVSCQSGRLTCELIMHVSSSSYDK